MPFNGSGTFTRVRNWVADATAAIKIRADFHDSEDDNFAAGLSNVICKDGQTTITANIPLNGKKLTNVGDPTATNDAATKAYVDAQIAAAQTSLTLPPGTMVPYGKGGTAPTGWLLCQGQAVSRTTYGPLFTAIGTTFGSGDGSTTFNLPDMRGMFPRGVDAGRGIDTGRALGTQQADGIKAHKHPSTAVTGSESADHTHTWSGSASSSSAGAHSHTATIPQHLYAVASGGVPLYAATDQAASNANMSVSTSAVGDHAHSVSMSGTTSGRSAAHTHAVTITPADNTGAVADTRPWNLALHWLIKT